MLFLKLIRAMLHAQQVGLAEVEVLAADELGVMQITRCHYVQIILLPEKASNA